MAIKNEFVKNEIMEKIGNIDNAEKMAEGITDAMCKKGLLTVNNIKELPVADILDVIGAVPVGARAFVVDGKICLVSSHEETINPYEDIIEIWEEFLDEQGISSYDVPFNKFYYYYKRYTTWLDEERLTEADTDFESYMSEIEHINEFYNLYVPENETVDVNEIRTERVFDGNIVADIKKLLSDVEDEADAFELLLQTAETKRADFARRKEMYQNLLA